MATTERTDRFNPAQTHDDQGPGVILWIIAFAVAGCLVWFVAGR